MNIEIKGVQFVNKGAELMLMAVLQKLNSHGVEFNLVLEANRKSPYLDRARLGAYQKVNLRKKIIDLNGMTYFFPISLRARLLKKFGIIFEADIDVILDASGFAYGDQWHEQTVVNMCREIDRFQKNSKRYILLPQALGPFNNKVMRKSLEASLPKANLVCARENTSYENLSFIPDRSNVEVHGDFTNLVNAVHDDNLDLSNTILVIPNSNMVSSKNKNSDWRESYVEVMCNAVRGAKALGYNVLILNHEGKADDLICKEISNHFGGDVQVIHEKDSLIVKGLIKQSLAIVCSRFHGCVSALSQGKACLGTSWSHKYEKLFEEYGRSEFLINPSISEGEMKVLLSNTIKTIDEPVYQEKIKLFKEKSKLMWESVFKAIY